MKFGTTPIPQELFELARQRLRRATSTPEQVRQYLLEHGQEALRRTNPIEHNHRIIANRVFQAVRRELVDSGELTQLKRGVWATTEFMRAAQA